MADFIGRIRMKNVRIRFIEWRTFDEDISGLVGIDQLCELRFYNT
jgi:hypothetical protein